jgi:hypothetical protein
MRGTKSRPKLFTPKRPPNRSHSMTDLGKRILAATAKRNGENESTVVELLARAYGGPSLDALIQALRADASAQ